MPNFKDKKLYAAIFTVILLCLFSFIKIKEYFFPFGFAHSLRGSADAKISAEWLIEPTLYKATGFRAGVAWIQEKANGSWRLIDTAGKTIVIEPPLYKAAAFRSGVAWVQEKENGAWKLIDTTGKIIVDGFQAENIGAYDEDTGLALFESNDSKMGYINLSGDIAISPQYHSGGGFDYGVTVVSKKIGGDDFSGVIDRHGETVLPLMHEGITIIDANLFSVRKDGKWGCINRKGEVIIDFISERPLRLVCPPNVLAATVTIRQKVGLIDNKGQWILPASYDQVYTGGEGLIALEKDGKIGFVDTLGNTVIDFQLPGARPKINGDVTYCTYGFSENLAVILLSEIPWGLKQPPQFEKALCGVIDKNGNTLFTFHGYPLSRFADGLILVDSPSGMLVIDQSGDQYPLPPSITVDSWEGESFSKEILRARYKKNKFGYLKINVK